MVSIGPNELNWLLCTIGYLSETHLEPKSHSSITLILFAQSFWNFAQSAAVILPWSVQNFKMIGLLKRMSWTNKISWEEFWRDILCCTAPMVPIDFDLDTCSLKYLKCLDKGKDTRITNHSNNYQLDWGPNILADIFKCITWEKIPLYVVLGESSWLAITLKFAKLIHALPLNITVVP